MKTGDRILITGATGFIGSHLTRSLIDKGIEVAAIIRDNSDLWRIKDLLENIKIYNVDLKDTEGIAQAMSSFDPNVVFHLATYYTVNHNSYDIHSMFDTNVLGTVNLLEASKDAMVDLFVNTSSFFVYRESLNALKESDQLNPLNLYALTKINAEEACTFYADKFNIRTVTFRLFPPYGPANNDGKLISYAIKTLLKGEKLRLTTGLQKWDFTYVDDIVDAYLKLLFHTAFPRNHEIFNIGSGEAITIKEVIMLLKEIIASETELQWGEVPHRGNEIWYNCADINKAKKLLRWMPKTQIADGLKLTIEWYKQL